MGWRGQVLRGKFPRLEASFGDAVLLDVESIPGEPEARTGSQGGAGGRRAQSGPGGLPVWTPHPLLKVFYTPLSELTAVPLSSLLAPFCFAWYLSAA